MRLLLKKSLRDFRQHWLSFGACLLIMALATALFVGFAASFANLGRSSEYTYQRLRFLDFSLYLRDAPRSVEEELRGLPGVEAVQARRSESARLLLPDGSHVRARVTGLPHDRRPEVNDVEVLEGSYLQASRGQILMESRFARARGLGVGEVVTLRSGENTHHYTLVGLVSTPEFIWLADNRFDPLPSASNFAVLFLSEGDVRSLGPSGVNQMHVRVTRPELMDAVMLQAAERLGARLSDPPEPRELQASHALLTRDRRAFAALAIVFPVVFVSLSAVILFATLYQLVSQQRYQIGVLMCQGFASEAIMRHYLAMSVAVGGAGALGGAFAGWGLSEAVTRFYASVLGLPFVVTTVPWEWMVAAVAIGLAVSLGAGWWATGRLLKLEPSQALRFDFNESVRTLRLERWVPGWSRMSVHIRFPVRNFLRQPGRSLAVVLGIAFSVAQILMTMAFFDSQAATVDFFFTRVHNYSLHADLAYPMSPSKAPPVAQWEGVEAVEGVLRQSARFQQGENVLEHNIWGLPEDGELLRLHDLNKRPYDLPEDGPLVFGPVVLRRMQAEPYKSMSVKLLAWDHPDPPETTVPVGPPLYEPVANPAKMPLKQLQRMAAATRDLPPDAINILLVKVRPDQLERVKERLYASPQVRNVEDMGGMRADLQELLRMFDAYKGLMFAFAGILAVALLAGTTAMNVRERARELAAMSVLGVRTSTMATLLLGEAIIAWLFGLILGIPGGLFLGNWLINSYQSELIQMSLAIRPGTVLGTALVSLAICLVGLGFSLRQVLGLSLASALRDRSG